MTRRPAVILAAVTGLWLGVNADTLPRMGHLHTVNLLLGGALALGAARSQYKRPDPLSTEALIRVADRKFFLAFPLLE